MSPSLETYDIVWVLFCAALVAVMQAGFLCLETGLSRAKNAADVAIKNLSGFALSTALFWLVGFRILYGTSWNGLVGGEGFALDTTEPGLLTFFLYQLMLCATCATIASRAVAERMKFSGRLVATLLVGFLYPVVGHWMWARPSLGPAGWLADQGFFDFAGSTVVHSTAAWVALAAMFVIGPRRSGVRRRWMTVPTAMLGVGLLWLGWFGFNGGSTFAASKRRGGYANASEMHCGFGSWRSPRTFSQRIGPSAWRPA